MRSRLKSRIGYRVNRRSIENYLRLPCGAARVDSTVSCRGASQSPVYRAAFRPIPLSFSTRRGHHRERARLPTPQAKTLTPFGTSLVRPPRARIPRCFWSFPRRIYYYSRTNQSPRPSEFLQPEHLRRDFNALRDVSTRIPPCAPPSLLPCLAVSDLLLSAIRVSRTFEGSLHGSITVRPDNKRKRTNSVNRVRMDET